MQIKTPLPPHYRNDPRNTPHTSNGNKPMPYGPWLRVGTAPASEHGNFWLSKKDDRLIVISLEPDSTKGIASIFVAPKTDWNLAAVKANFLAPRMLGETEKAINEAFDGKDGQLKNPLPAHLETLMNDLDHHAAHTRKPKAKICDYLDEEKYVLTHKHSIHQAHSKFEDWRKSWVPITGVNYATPDGEPVTIERISKPEWLSSYNKRGNFLTIVDADGQQYITHAKQLDAINMELLHIHGYRPAHSLAVPFADQQLFVPSHEMSDSNIDIIVDDIRNSRPSQKHNFKQTPAGRG